MRQMPEEVKNSIGPFTKWMRGEKELEEYYKNRKYGNKYERRISKAIILNPDYQKVFKGPIIVYEYLWAYIVRGKMKSDKLNIKKNYYDKGFLACTRTYRRIAEEVGMYHHRVQRHIQLLNEAGVIKIDKIKIDNCRYQNVYILGTWKEINGQKIETFYFDEVFDSGP